MSSTDDREAGKGCESPGAKAERYERGRMIELGLVEPDRPDAIPDVAVEAVGDAMDDWLHRMHGVISSSRAATDGGAADVIAALLPFLPARAPEGMVDIEALLTDDDAMLTLSEVTWKHAGTAMPCSAEGGRKGLRAALARFGAPSEESDNA